MKILLTGATGFTGKYVIQDLLKSGHDLHYLVRNKKGFDNEFIWDFKRPLSDEIPKCDVIIHLAAYVNFTSNLDIEQYNVNTVSTMQLASYAQSCGAYFILASMAGVHGSQNATIDAEKQLAPENHYAISKYLAEEVVKTFLDSYAILRICGIYGINGPAHLGINNAINDAVHNKKPPILHGSGKAKRNYICVLDVGRWISNLVNKYETNIINKSGNAQEILYLSSTEIMTIEQYLRALTSVLLPDMEIGRKEGKEAADLVVTPSPAPFKMMSFKEYLYSIKQSSTKL